MYVANNVSGCPSVESALNYFTDYHSLLSSEGFNLRSWSSNCSQLQHVALQCKVAEQSNPVKVLEMYWNTENDTIYVSPNLDTTFPQNETFLSGHQAFLIHWGYYHQSQFCKALLATALARKFRVGHYTWSQSLHSMDHNCFQYCTSHRLVLSP